MVDNLRRKQLAEAIRHYGAGVITEQEFLRRSDATVPHRQRREDRDDGLQQVWRGLYGDVDDLEADGLHRSQQQSRELKRDFA
jgi:hypothetical protein